MFQPRNPNRFLRAVMGADAASCAATGALQLVGGAAVASLLGLPAVLLFGTGVFLLGYAALAAAIALREQPPRWLVGFIALGNAGWTVACVALLLSGSVVPTALGVAYVLVQGVTTLVLAELQWIGLRAGGGRSTAGAVPAASW
jgi:hypothetical protein